MFDDKTNYFLQLIFDDLSIRIKIPRIIKHWKEFLGIYLKFLENSICNKFLIEEIDLKN